MLGDKLLEKGLITQVQLDAALAEQMKSPGERLGDILVRLGFITNGQIEKAL
jgi:hypothetical protein